MEKQQQNTLDGLEVQEQDWNQLGESAGLADDRVFHELFRLRPYDGTNVSRGILRSNLNPVVQSSGTTDGSIKVNPYRAMIGSRTAEATEARKNWRDIRSGLSVAEGATSLQTTFALSANASGSTRWDLVYAAITPNAPGDSITRYQKDTTSEAVTAQTVATYLVTTVTTAVLEGAAGSGFPTIPADDGTTYYIPLAFVRVPNGFTSASTIAAKDINSQAPCLSLSAATGALTLRPATSNSKNGGAGTSGSGTTTSNGPTGWTDTAGARPAAYLPAEWSGGHSVIVALDLTNATAANRSHQNGDVVDNSIDWRGRMCWWTANVSQSSNGHFPWAANGLVGTYLAMTSGNLVDTATGSYPAHTSSGVIFGTGFGAYSPNQSNDYAIMKLITSGAAGTGTPAAGCNVPTTQMLTGTTICLYADRNTGELKLFVSGNPGCTVFVKIDASAPYPNML